MIPASYYPAGVTEVAGEVVWTIVVAGGGGQRYGAAKQFEALGPARVVDRAVETARRASVGVVVVVPAAEAAAEGGVAGGATRAESVRNGLAAVPPEATIICVHDAARPLASAALFDAVIGAVAAGADGVVPAVPVTDTVKIVDATGTVVSTPDRAALVAVQTPQGFRARALRRAHASGADGTDDASLVERIGGRVVTVPGEASNRKITAPDDLEWARQWLAAVEQGLHA
jgi:2-C-methyl-D-erythritol 4-phosphate cytidylyltransferase